MIIEFKNWWESRKIDRYLECLRKHYIITGSSLFVNQLNIENDYYYRSITLNIRNRTYTFDFRRFSEMKLQIEMKAKLKDKLDDNFDCG